MIFIFLISVGSLMMGLLSKRLVCFPEGETEGERSRIKLYTIVFWSVKRTNRRIRDQSWWYGESQRLWSWGTYPIKHIPRSDRHIHLPQRHLLEPRSCSLLPLLPSTFSLPPVIYILCFYLCFFLKQDSFEKSSVFFFFRVLGLLSLFIFIPIDDRSKYGLKLAR